MSKKTYMLLITIEVKDGYQLHRNINSLNSDEVRIDDGDADGSFQIVDGDELATLIDDIKDQLCHDEMWQIEGITLTEYNDYDNDEETEK